MDSMKSFRADEAEEQAYRRKTRKRVVIIIISTILLVLITVAAVLGVALPSKTSNSTQSPSSTSSFSSIQSICSITQYPKSCISSLTSRQNPNTGSDSDPLHLFNLSLQISIDELSNISSIPESLSTQASDIRVKNALNDCKLLFSNAIKQLNDSLSSTKLDDIRTWISAALTNQETCLDNIGSVSVEFRGLMQTAMENSTEYTSNSLAIATKVLKLLQDFNLPVHRKLLGEESPSWVSAEKERKLLQDGAPKADLVVAKDGSGTYRSIAEVVASAPEKICEICEGGGCIRRGLRLIYISRWNVMMFGDGKEKTIVSGSLNVRDGTQTLDTATSIELFNEN